VSARGNGDLKMNLGLLIRKHRKQKKLTLRAVAEKAGISEGFLSQVENSVNSPSVDTLINICNALGVNAGDLLNEMNKHEQLVFIPRSEWNEVDLPHTGFATQRFFSPEDRQSLDSAILHMDTGASIPVRKNIKNGQEILCVLDGEVELIYADRTIHMRAGDAVHYFANPSRQVITNKEKQPAVIFWAGTL
jgi:transcriptional regulator with XRE-family HTH domain